MEEADTLCTRIGIMAKGELRALGSPTYLKSKYGEGFKFSVITSAQLGELAQKNLLEDIRNTFCSDALLYSHLGVSFTYLFPKEAMSSSQLMRVFEVMESRTQEFKKKHSIQEWGVSQATLEEVFLKTV